MNDRRYYQRATALRETFSRNAPDEHVAFHARTFGRAPSVPAQGDWDCLSAEQITERLASDDELAVNDLFPYWIVAPRSGHRTYGRAIVLLHGLNERRWDKYLPWADALVARLDVPVVLFPMALHIDRAPRAWSDPHRMNDVSKARKALRAVDSSFANAALSTRLQTQPLRFFWSGLRTVRDLDRLAQEISSGREPLIAGDAQLDLFGYSIGAFVSMVLLTSAMHGTWTKARHFLFCGGCTLAACNPRSKEILDSEATVALRRCFDDDLDAERNRHPSFGLALDDDPAGRSFLAMLHPRKQVDARRGLLARLRGRMRGTGLVRDAVMPASSIQQVFAEAHAPFVELDFPFRYTHAVPFPIKGANEAEVDEAFQGVFDEAASFLA